MADTIHMVFLDLTVDIDSQLPFSQDVAKSFQDLEFISDSMEVITYRLFCSILFEGFQFPTN